MSAALERQADRLVRATRALLVALEESGAEAEVAALIDAQREAFNAFSLSCDPDAPRSSQVERDIHELLELDRRIVAVAEAQSAGLHWQQRKMSRQQSAARAFRFAEEAPPRFFNERI